jgi:hypothetical protein
VRIGEELLLLNIPPPQTEAVFDVKLHLVRVGDEVEELHIAPPYEAAFEVKLQLVRTGAEE